MIVLFCDIALFLIVINFNFVLYNTSINAYFDICIYSYLVFCIIILPVILMIKKDKRTLKSHLVSLIIINFAAFYNYHLTLRSLILSFYFLETIFLDGIKYQKNKYGVQKL